jgi:sugar O-acyltransferase (sialic acid O-acetyltransferase NeuD family)
MNKKNVKELVIFGTGKIGETAFHYLEKDSELKIAAFTVDKKYMTSDTFMGLPVVAFEDIEQKYPNDKYCMLVMVGYQNINRIREQKYGEAQKKGYELISYISSHANVGNNVEIGENCFICEFNSIQPGVKIGNNVVMWPNNLVSHHAVIQDNCWITAGVSISGSTTLEPNCFIGVNSAIGHEINIGFESIIGAGCLITKNVDPKSVYIQPNTEKYKLDSITFARFTKL